MSATGSYRELRVWQKAMDLAEAVYTAMQQLPREETYGLISQMRSAAVSVAANIAEGHGRSSQGEFKQFLGIARGSLAELETEVMLAGRVKLLDTKACERLLTMSDDIGKMLRGLLKALAERKAAGHSA